MGSCSDKMGLNNCWLTRTLVLQWWLIKWHFQNEAATEPSRQFRYFAATEPSTVILRQFIRWHCIWLESQFMVLALGLGLWSVLVLFVVVHSIKEHRYFWCILLLTFSAIIRSGITLRLKPQPMPFQNHDVKDKIILTFTVIKLPTLTNVLL